MPVPLTLERTAGGKATEAYLCKSSCLSLAFFLLHVGICLKCWTLDTRDRQWAGAGLDFLSDFINSCWTFSFTNQEAACVCSPCRHQTSHGGLQEDNSEDLLPTTKEGDTHTKRWHWFSISLIYSCSFSAQGGCKAGFLLKSLMTQSPSESRPAIVSGVWLDRGNRSVLVGLGSSGAEGKRRLVVYSSQRDWGCPRGPCVLQLWTSTAGPPSGWVQQPGLM